MRSDSELSPILGSRLLGPASMAMVTVSFSDGGEPQDCKRVKAKGKRRKAKRAEGRRIWPNTLSKRNVAWQFSPRFPDSTLRTVTSRPFFLDPFVFRLSLYPPQPFIVVAVNHLA